MPDFSIIVPVLDEAPQLEAALNALAPITRDAEILVVDGGSRDGSAELARTLCRRGQDCRVLTAPRGRASQMNAGARVARGEVLIFLHGDCRLPTDALDAIRLARHRTGWGYFGVRLVGRAALLRQIGRAALLRVVGALMNLRSRLSRIATGDQAIWVERALFEHVGGYPDIALMEDLALSRALARVTRPAMLAGPVRVSARRWERDGVWRTILLMWRLRLAWALGAHPDDLAARYYPDRAARPVAQRPAQQR
jgi:rSAM/selenodomain-associated transferase 2